MIFPDFVNRSASGERTTLEEAALRHGLGFSTPIEIWGMAPKKWLVYGCLLLQICHFIGFDLSPYSN